MWTARPRNPVSPVTPRHRQRRPPGPGFRGVGIVRRRTGRLPRYAVRDRARGIRRRCRTRRLVQQFRHPQIDLRDRQAQPLRGTGQIHPNAGSRHRKRCLRRGRQIGRHPQPARRQRARRSRYGRLGHRFRIGERHPHPAQPHPRRPGHRLPQHRHRRALGDPGTVTGAAQRQQPAQPQSAPHLIRPPLCRHCSSVPHLGRAFAEPHLRWSEDDTWSNDDDRRDVRR
ncbi:hypothetical protein GCM10020256_60780 [Streptomyces thermocoprophilus]